MFSSPTPASGSRAVAARALRSAGLIDKDTHMRDAEDTPGGKKSSLKFRRRTRGNDSAKGQALGTSQRTLATRAARGTPPDSLSIRGASRPPLPGRVRRDRVAGSRLDAVDAWRQLVDKRYDKTTRFLDLESLINDEIVKTHPLNPPGYKGDRSTAAVIFKLAGQLKPKVETLSLANNNLSGKHLLDLNRYLPNLRNLSLQGNSLKDWNDLDQIGAKEKNKLKHLRELVLLGNPLREMEYKNGRGDRYRSEIARRFLALEVLDSEAITRVGFTDDSVPESAPSVPKPSATTFPFEMGLSFVTGVSGNLVVDFLVKFFEYFDTRRTDLLDVYDSQANFSYCCNTSIPVRARIENLHYTMPNQKKLEWSPWLRNPGGVSRNLLRPQVSIDEMVDNLHMGPNKISAAQAALPKTKHDMQDAAHKFVVDAFPVPHRDGSALLVTLHGEFMEVETQGVRSFDRSFTLLPAPEGSKAKLNGWEVVILSDQLTIRGYSNPNAWKVGPMLVQAQAKSMNAQKSAELSVSSSLEQQEALRNMPEAQQNLVFQICRQTRLNVNYAMQCLNSNGWDFERAVTNFEQVKETLPQDAFL